VAYNIGRAEIAEKIRSAKHVILGRHIGATTAIETNGTKVTRLEFSGGGGAPEKQWMSFLKQDLKWIEDEDSKPTTLNWDETISTMSVQLCDLCLRYNFI
jgi:hypothetical protein